MHAHCTFVGNGCKQSEAFQRKNPRMLLRGFRYSLVEPYPRSLTASTITILALTMMLEKVIGFSTMLINRHCL